MTCWADALGGCGGGTSREHIISRSQFEDNAITVSGLPWCQEPKTVGLASLVARNLCRDHNSQLSPADHEALMFRLSVKAVHQAIFLPVRVNLDARLIERWLLKTIINLSLQSPDSGLEVTPELVRRAFGLASTPRAQGFFAVVEMNEQLDYGGGIRFETLVRKEDGRLVVGAFRFHGWRALYAFDGAPPVRGALRVRAWNGEPHWLRFRWQPDLEPGDKTMPALAPRP